MKMTLVGADFSRDECIQDIEQKRTAILVSSVILIIVTIIFLAKFIHFTARIWTLAWRNDKVFPLMLISLCASLVSILAFWVYTIYEVAYPEWSCDGNAFQMCSGSFVRILPSMFLAIGVILNLNKWVYFMLRIWAFIRVGFGESKETA